MVGVSSAGEYVTLYVLPDSTVLGATLISRAAAATRKAAPAKRVWMKSILIIWLVIVVSFGGDVKS